MELVTKMLKTHPHSIVSEELARCIELCLACEMTCTSCADANLAEDDLPDLVRCIRLCLDCADICNATGRVLTRQTNVDQSVVLKVLETCVQACRVSAEECERHAEHHEHCRVCGETCRRCEQACEDLRGSMLG